MREGIDLDSTDRQYILGTKDEELARLGLQHQLWSETTVRTWKRAGFRPGQHLFDAGCGPGYATFDLAQLMGPDGHVTGVDKSGRFIHYCQAQIEARGVSNITVKVHDLENQDLPPSGFDGAYARWVFCFLQNPESAVSAIARSLKKGAVFAIQDYYNYRTLDLYPECEVFKKVYAAVWESWRMRGGSPEIGRRLPEMLTANGIEVTHINPIIRIARPGTAFWKWPESFFVSYMPTLVEMGLITEKDRQLFLQDWRERSANPEAFFTTPVNIEIIGRKR